MYLAGLATDIPVFEILKIITFIFCTFSLVQGGQHQGRFEFGGGSCLTEQNKLESSQRSYTHRQRRKRDRGANKHHRQILLLS